MDEKELLRRTKNSLRAGKTPAQILEGFQKRGYKLAYAQRILDKAYRPKRIGIIFVCLVVLLVSAFIAGKALVELEQLREESEQYFTGNVVASLPSFAVQGESAVVVDEASITQLLYVLRADLLHSAPFMGEPIINLVVDESLYHAVITNGIITTYASLDAGADIEFTVTSEEIQRVLDASQKQELLRESFEQGRITMVMKASNMELYAKGYLELYNALT